MSLETVAARLEDLAVELDNGELQTLADELTALYEKKGEEKEVKTEMERMLEGFIYSLFQRGLLDTERLLYHDRERMMRQQVTMHARYAIPNTFSNTFFVNPI